MRTTTERLDIKLSNAELFAQIMKANGYTVRTLAESVQHILIRKHSAARISKSTIGHLRSGARNTVNSDVALAIAELFNLPANALFTPKVITVTRDIPKARITK
jgi:ribosomal protein L18